MRRWIAVGLLMVGLMATQAPGDGMMAPREGVATALVASPKQEAVLIHDGQTVTVVLRTHFTATADEVAWVVPVPGEPTDIGAASEDVFTSLERETAPVFMERGSYGGPAFGCAAQAPRLASPLPAVTVEATGAVRIFDYAVLAAKDPGDLAEWLRTNGYVVPTNAAATFGHYIHEGYRFLAMKLRAEATAEARAKTLAPHPVRYRYRAQGLTFPLIISRLSAAAQNEVVLYIVAHSRLGATNFTNAILNEAAVSHLGRDPAAASGTTYEASFLRAAGRDPHFLVTEYAGPLRPASQQELQQWIGFEQPVLTRLRTVLTPAAMDRDLKLGLVEEGAVPNRHVLSTRGTGIGAAMAIACLTGLALPAARAGANRTRRRGVLWRVLVVIGAMALVVI